MKKGLIYNINNNFRKWRAKTMEKIKTSELFEKLVQEIQKSYISEDKQMQNATLDYLKGKTENMSLKDVLTLIELNNEFLRSSYIKAVCSILSDYGIIENDIDIYDTEVTNKLLKSGVHKAIHNQ